MHLGDSGPSNTLFLSGDVMTGRGIDQILSHPSEPRLYESWVKDAREYVELAEAHHGAMERPVSNAYIWGDALPELERVSPDLRLINLETSITTSSMPWIGKGIHYRMHPSNIGSLSVAGIHGCVLANNHVLDWGFEGLEETLAVLHRANIATAGAGPNRAVAERPAVFSLPGGRVLLMACGLDSSGVDESWAATWNSPGVFYLPDLSTRSVEAIARVIDAVKQPRDVVILSVHWGSNWGYRIEPEQREFARAVIDSAGIDVIHGHSSHHPRGIEVYRDKLILYGCGDLINDYEGISGHEHYRGDLALMYFVTVSAHGGQLQSLRMVPMQMRKFSLHHACVTDIHWLGDVLGEISREFGSSCRVEADRSLALHWR